jgi:hypothetical protein
MTAVLAAVLLFSIAMDVAVAFANPRQRPKLKRVLVATLVVAWIALGAAVAQAVARTARTYVMPGGAQRPHLVEEATREGVTLLLSMGGPLLFATFIGWLALRASRRKEA